VGALRYSTGRVYRGIRMLACAVAMMGSAAHALDPGSDLSSQLQAERRQRLEVIVAGTSEQIDSEQVEGAALAEALRKRGAARVNLRQYAEALADLSRAIEIEPFNALGHEYRGRAYLKLRRFQEAGADLDMALGLDPKRWSAERDKGRIAAYQADFLQAAVQFRRAWRWADDDASAYNAVWVDIASRRAGEDGTHVLDELLAEMDAQKWPAPVLGMLRGTVSPEEVIALASSPDPRQALPQECEAYFYAGELYLLRGETLPARAAFTAAVQTGVIDYLEYDWALRELELLGEGR
jgi:lipoprotein NlpI